MVKSAPLSEAMTWSKGQGLFHPNCRHSVSIFIEGVTVIPPPRMPEEIQREQEAYKKSQDINYTNRQIQSWKNRKATAITPEELTKSNARLKAWRARKKELVTGAKVTPIKIPTQNTARTFAPSTSPKNFKPNLTKFENDIRAGATETAGIFDYNGNVIIDKRGGKNYVQFEPDEVAKMKGNILTHNHPSGSSFSSEDIYMLTSGKINEIRAVSTYADYNLKITGGGESDFSYLSPTGIKNKYNDIRIDLQDKYQTKVTAGMDSNEAWHAHSHELITQLSKDLKLDYTRKLVK
jgi:hypothetical protein